MRALRLCSLAWVALTLVACVTINVYFPAVAAERAADRIIHDVWGKQAPPADDQPAEDAPGDEPAPQSRRDADRQRPMVAVVGAALAALIPAAQAAEPNIDISSPAIRQITASMEQRYPQLKPYYDSGAIGLTQDALIAIRDLNAVPLAERGHVRQLVAAANDDRNALYAEIARANGHPEWEDQIRQVFARRWVANAPSGWYYQNDSGEWVRK